MKTIELNVSRKLNAKPSEIFDAWLDKSPGSPWFGTNEAVVQAKVGGLFYHCVHHAGHDWAHYGRFVALERPAKIQHTWVSEATRGRETMLTITLSPEGEQTLVHIHHANVPDDDMGRQHEQGWNFVLDSLAQRFSARVKP